MPSLSTRRFLVLAVGVAVAACAVAWSGQVPDRVRLDAADGPLAEQVAAARGLLDRGDAAAALARVNELAATGSASVDLQRLRQDALRQRGRMGLLRAEAEARVAAAPQDAVAHYLLGRVSSGARMVAGFRRASELDPTVVWPWLGLAFALRDDNPAESLAIYERLYAASDRLPVVAIAYGNALRSNGRLREAIAVYEQLAEQQSASGVGQLGLSQSLFAQGGPSDRQRGWAMLLTALELRPFDPGVHAVLRELLRLGMADDQIEQCLDVLRAAPERCAELGRGSGAEVLIALLQRSQQPHAALRWLDDVGSMAAQPQLRRLQRRLLLQTGDARGFLARLVRDLPIDLLRDPQNEVGSRWRSLIDGPWKDGDPLAGAETAVGFVAALRDVGLLAEAEQLAGIARQRFGAVAGLDELAAEIGREIAFEDAVRRFLYQGYAEAAVVDLDAALLRIRQLSLSLLGRDVVGDDHRFRVPFVGEMLDPFRAGLCRHFARYNRYLVLGRRAGGQIEGLAMTQLSVRDLPAMAELPLPGRCREVVGFDRSVRSLSGVLGGDLAGVALLNHFVVDHDAVVEWAQAIAARHDAALADGNVVLDDPLPVDADPLEALDVNWRLSALSPVQDTALADAVLEVIRLHERRHLVDSFHYLPLEANLWRGLGLLLGFGFSASAIEAEMEGRAELAALALCRVPGIALAHIAEFVGGDEASPHARGFTVLARQLMAELVAAGVAPADAAISRWHRLDPAIVQRCARLLLSRLP